MVLQNLQCRYKQKYFLKDPDAFHQQKQVFSTNKFLKIRARITYIKENFFVCYYEKLTFYKTKSIQIHFQNNHFTFNTSDSVYFVKVLLFTIQKTSFRSFLLRTYQLKNFSIKRVFCLYGTFKIQKFNLQIFILQ